MKQILQNLRDGSAEIAEVPVPALRAGQVLVRSSVSLLSTGTERTLVEFGKASLVNKARQQPERVRQVLDKVRTDGLLPTLEALRDKLDQPLPLGYCNVGTVLETASGVSGFSRGDRVASNGRHAEVVAVPAILCARVPSSVSDEEAAFTVLGAIALQGIRLAQPGLGEAVAVIGLGLVGLLTVQLLKAHGCRVLGLDVNPERLRLAEAFGAEAFHVGEGDDPLAAASAFSRGRGLDAVLIAAATDSNEPIHQAAQMCRKRGRIVLVGVAGLELSRADFYEKELTFQVSCSYGPGRYDSNYEDKGIDYPVGFVRWTEQRNFEAVLDMLATGRLDVKSLISHRFALVQAQQAYDLITSGSSSLGVLITYPAAAEKPEEAIRASTVAVKPHTAPTGAVRLGFIGAGNHAVRTLIPAFQAANVAFAAIASLGGISSAVAARKYGFVEATTDAESILADPQIDAVVISTRHDSHADFVCRALGAGKHVFVEKPLALTMEDLRRIETMLAGLPEGQAPLLAVGFNRRFAPQVQKMKQLLSAAPLPKSIVITVNAGVLSSGHWAQDRDVGGGRIIGEACHFIDLLRFLAAAPIVRHSSHRMSSPNGDTATISLEFADGSIGTVHYFGNGYRAFPKERVEVFCGGRILQLDNFRRLRGYGWPGFRSMGLWRQDKGQNACVAAFVRAVSLGGPVPIPSEEIIEVSRTAIAAAEAARE